MQKNILILPGDGIGPEITAQAVRVLQAVAQGTDLSLNFIDGLIGGAALKPDQFVDIINAANQE